MKNKLSVAFLCVVFLTSCQKFIDKQKENVLIKTVTDGYWLVDFYQQGADTVTGQFVGYKFKFYEENTVEGISSTGISTMGSWDANIDSLTITAQFPDTTGEPLTKLNATWKITDAYSNYVEANATIDGVKRYLHLLKDE